jgi:ABC-type iron transport system FetAB permease component
MILMQPLSEQQISAPPDLFGLEAYLALGAMPQQASAEAARRATVAAIIRTINALAVVVSTRV